MIIKSQFKDYYDYIEHLNGGDPKVVYLRNRLKPLENSELPFISFEYHLQRSLPITHGNSFPYCDFKWCIVAGKHYLLVQETPPDKPIKPWTLVTPDSEIMEILCPPKPKKTHYWSGPPKTIDYFFGSSTPSSIELCKKIQQPVFIVINGFGYVDGKDAYFHKRKARVHSVIIESELPILHNLGFASIIPANTMYQDIAYFMSNTIRDNPDISPPVEINNIDKIISHGFDLQKSFRHRRNNEND